MAQSVILSRTPVGIPFFWDRGMEPRLEWTTWAATLKRTIIAKESINVDYVLRYKPEPKDLFYPDEPTYEPPGQNKTQIKHRDRDQRNVKINSTRKMNAKPLSSKVHSWTVSRGTSPPPKSKM